MEEEGHVLDEDEFTDACNRLYSTLSIHEKNILLKARKGQPQKYSEEPSF
jgi:hypothetical protein